jgi:diguanylate cyclase (GGDEF)-like protein
MTEPDSALLTAAALGTQAGDLLVQVGPDRAVSWSSDGSIEAGTPFASLLDPRDDGQLGELLGDGPTGPVVVRLSVDASRTEARTATVVAVPRDGGWLAQLRGTRPTPGRAVVDPWHGAGAGRVVDGQQALDELAWLLSATPRTGKEIAVAAFDLDGFAETNAVRGREVGDLVLQAVAERVLAAVRSGDLVGRLEGDQFIVVLRGVHHLRGAIRVANKLRAAVEDPIPVPGGDVVQTISVGVTLVSLGEDVDGVLERAASAVAMAKAVGGNVVRSEPPI